jgi:NADPH:quinone reductase-like Zn-dependent oxidoreductase
MRGGEAATFCALGPAQRADLEALRQQIEAGHLTPIVGKTYLLPEVPEAIRHLEGGRAQGKLAITV